MSVYLRYLHLSVIICHFQGGDTNIGGAKAQSSREIIAGFENGAVSGHRVEMASLCAMCHVHSDIVADSFSFVCLYIYTYI